MMTELQESFLQLVRLGIGTRDFSSSSTSEATRSSVRFQAPGSVYWAQMKTLADEQGLSAIVLDGVEKFPNEQRPPQQFLLEWIGEVLQEYEYRYEVYKKTIAKLAGWYNANGFKMMVLKGYACSLDWPKPEHRPCGDIDIWQFGKQKEADAALEASIKNQDPSFKIDNSHHHHTVFSWGDFTVENHYDFINVHHHKSHVALEKTLKELGMDDSHYVEMADASTPSTGSGTGSATKVYLPSANLHALFLIKHAALHFVGTELTFRQVLDWAFFVQKHGKEVDWDWLYEVIEEHGMMPFFCILNAICVGDLGFEARLFPKNQHLPELKDRVVTEIFASVYHGSESSNLFVRQIKRFKRWKSNAWKHVLCYKESMWSAFWSGIWGHLLKPASI